MSLVTTASASSSPRLRHSAATRAVLPLPTGPPMPIRNGRARSFGWLRRKETDLRDGVLFGPDVEQWGGAARELVEGAGGASGRFGRDLGRVLHERRHDPPRGEGVEAEQAHGGGGRAGDGVVGGPPGGA